MAAPNFSTTFNIVTKKFEFTDLNTNSVSPADIKGYFTSIIDPNGNVIYNNSNPIFQNGEINNKELTSNVAILTATIPPSPALNVGDELTINIGDAAFDGNYTVAAGTTGTTIKYAKVGANVVSTPVTPAPNQWISTKWDIDGVVDSALENVLPIDLPLNSDGTIVKGTYTISYQSFILGVGQLLITKTYNFQYDSPKIAISQVVNCLAPLFTTSDITNYIVNTVMPTISRVHTLNYPYNTSNLPVAPPVTGGITFSAPFYSGTQTTDIESTLTYVFPDGLIVSDYITGRKEILVDCSFVCKIYCCLRALLTRKEAARGVNQTAFDECSKKLGEITDLLTMIELAQSCGKSQDINSYTATIQWIADCTEDCTCSDGEPKLVTGLGGGGVSGAVSIIGISPISAVYNGVTSQWEISLSPAIVNKINTPPITDGSGNIVVTPTTNPVTGQITYTVSETIPATAPQNRCEFNIELSNVGGGTPLGVSVINELISGTMSSPTVVPCVSNTVSPFEGIPTIITTIPDLTTRNNEFKISDFQVTPNKNFKITGKISIKDIVNNTDILPLDIVFFNIEDGSVHFSLAKLYDNISMTYTTLLQELLNSVIRITIKISE